MFDQYFAARIEVEKNQGRCDLLFTCLDVLQAELDSARWHTEIEEMGKPSRILPRTPLESEDDSIPSPS